MLLHTPAIVLSRTRLEESSVIVRLYSSAAGKLSVVAKAARRPAGRFGAALEPGTLVQATIYQHENRNLHLLSSAEITKSHTELREGGEIWANLATVLETVDRLTAEEDPSPQKYTLLVRALAALPNKPHSVALAFRFQFIRLSGFGLSFSRCVVCGKDLAEHARYSAHDGGLACMRCFSISPDALEVPGEYRGALSYLNRTTMVGAGNLPMEVGLIEVAERLLAAHLNYVADVRLRSVGHVRHLEGL